MTPNNIINMAFIKELDIISVTDHNTAGNLKSIFSVAQKLGVVVVPGIEVNTKEEIHVLCYFEDIEDCLKFSKVIYESLPNVSVKEEMFGKQCYLDDEDNLIKKEKKFLLSACGYGIKDVYKLVENLGGVVVPAHIDKKSYSVLSVLGFLPFDVEVTAVEVTKNFDQTKYSKLIKENIKKIRNSDAHYLEHINEPENFMDLEDKTASSVVKYLKRKVEVTKWRNYHFIY